MLWYKNTFFNIYFRKVQLVFLKDKEKASYVFIHHDIYLITVIPIKLYKLKVYQVILLIITRILPDCKLIFFSEGFRPKQFRMDTSCQIFKAVHQTRRRAVKKVGVFKVYTLISDSRQAGPFAPFFFYPLEYGIS